MESARREDEIREVLEGPRKAIWLVGARQMGKTSFLRELERRAGRSPQAAYVPIYWDLEGVGSTEDLDRSFRQSLHRASMRLDSQGISASELEVDSYADSVRRLQRQLGRQGLELLLLCDNAQSLVDIGERQEAPRMLGKLRRTLQTAEGVRTVLASTFHLWRLQESRSNTSGFLDGLTPPLYLSALGREASTTLIHQVTRDTDAAERFDAPRVEEILRICGGHPGLLTRLTKAVVQTGDIAVARRRIAADAVVMGGLSSDFESLPRVERSILLELSQPDMDITELQLGDRLGTPPDTVKGGLRTLADLGLVAGLDSGRPAIANLFLQDWLREMPRSSSSASADRLTSPIEKSEDRLDRVAMILAESSRRGGEVVEAEELFELVYAELHERARRHMLHERPSHTLQATALVHEAYLKLANRTHVDWRGRSHFLAAGAQAMRRILIDHARGRGRDKRGGAQLRVTLNDWATPSVEGNLDFEELLSLHRALERLSEVHERQARIVELRFFAGLTMDEIAHALGISKRTVESDWATAREWLRSRLLQDPA